MQQYGTTTTGVARSTSSGLRLLVIDPTSTWRCIDHDLREHGELAIGRDASCPIRLDDSAVSRTHAILHVGDELVLEDRGGRNGTYVRERRMPAHGRLTIGPGDVIRIAGFALMLYDTAPPPPSRRVWPHGTFEGYVAHECARERARGGSFAVARIRCNQLVPEAAIDATIATHAREIDVIGRYAARDYELLIVEVTADAARAEVERIAAALAARGAPARTGLACFPRDGQTSAALLAAADTALRGAGTPPAGTSSEQLDRLVERLAASKLSVLILGETGAGKEVTARRLHALSARAARPFVSVHCAALPPALIESELFGHERGAFTGAHARKLGLFESADGGTVFLDEIGELPEAIQVRLLRVLDERSVVRIGAVRPQSIDVRFVAATNRDLEQAVAAGTFRRDLYYRLNGVTLVVPPLRQRRDEIATLASAFVRDAASRLDRPAPALSPQALAHLDAYAWPGNIRELRNMIERAVVLCEGDTLDPEHLAMEMLTTLVTAAPDGAVDPERARIVEALHRCSGNQTRAAKLLGISLRTLINRIERFDLPRPRRSSE